MAIWLGTPIVSMIVVPQITGKSEVPLMFANFGLPAIVLLLTQRVFMFYAMFLALISLFSKKLRTRLERKTEPNKYYGIGAIPIALILYGILGWLCSLYWPEEGEHLIKSHLMIGLVWSLCVYFLFQKRIFGEWDEE